jgi:dihydrofolate reductase
MDIVVLAAVAENGVIGRGNALPWRLKSDMMHFRAVTMGKPVVMGRKTYLSIGKPLKGRTTIVVSRDDTFAAPGILAAPNLDVALDAARGDGLRRNSGEIFIIGGAEIYIQALPLAARLLITEVHKRVDGDTRFPAIDSAIWREIERREQEPGTEDEAPFALVAYERANEAAMRQPGVA